VIAARSLVADRLRIPFRRPFATATGMWLERDLWLLRLADTDGRIGLGEAVLDSEATEVMETLLAALIREAVEAATAGDLPARDDLEIHGAPGRALYAALESARLDLERAAPPAGDPAGRDAGGDVETGVGVNATLPSLGPDAIAEAARQSVEAGFATLKVKGGNERETEVLVDRIAAVRRAVGPDIRLRLDVNGAWDLATAEDRLDAIARLDLEFVEQPLPPGDSDALATLRRHVRVPIAADESVESVRAARELLAADAVDALVVKLARVGGPAAAAEIAELAAARGVPVVMSNLFETGVGIAAALAVAGDLPVVDPAHEGPPDHGLATAGLLDHDLLMRSLILDEGRLRAPGGDGSSGLGIVLDTRAVERFRVESIGSAA
jgi:L-alanine-DL-glutamate epimerase-like enolase superfamily enzyme